MDDVPIDVVVATRITRREFKRPAGFSLPDYRREYRKKGRRQTASIEGSDWSGPGL
jgi:hypothetical protein